MELLKNIETRPDVMMGKPCLKGTRIPVYLVSEKLGAGETAENIRDAYPEITGDLAVDLLEEQRRAMVAFAESHKNCGAAAGEDSTEYIRDLRRGARLERLQQQSAGVDVYP
jgi:uncharacterized protein (DUF433 family)